MGKGKPKSTPQYQENSGHPLSKVMTAMSNGNLDDVITLSTTSLTWLMELQVLELLNLRATAYEQKGLLSRALDDANRMILYVPSSPSGYFKAGSILMTNGKPNLALASYEKGLSVASKSHHQYRKIQEECVKAATCAQKRVDIIGRLPRELVHKVLINMDSERVWVCLKVSRRWCEQVSKCGTWWSSVTVKQTGTDIDQAMCDAIPLVKDHIQQLELANLASQELNKKYLRHLKYGMFKNLKMLSLKGAFFDNILSEDFAISLWLVRGTLESLKIDFVSTPNSIPLVMVLDSCPDIVDICFTTTGDLEPWSTNLSYTSKCEKLLNMELSYGGSTRYSTLDNHLALCPNLRRLILKTSGLQYLGECDTKITNCCPRLKILGLNYTEGLQELGNYEHSTDKIGIDEIAVKIYKQSDVYQAAKVINGQADSLRRLSITRIQYLDGYDYYNSYSTHTATPTFKNLDTLSFRTGPSPSSHITNYSYNQGGGRIVNVQSYIGDLIQKSPSLNNLSLAGGPYESTYIRTPLEQAVKAKLRNLTLDTISFQNTTHEWYNSFFSSLDWVHAFVIKNIDMSNGKLLSLATSQSIIQLTISNCKGVTEDELKGFFKNVATKPAHQLTILELNNLPVGFDESTVRMLAKIRELQTIRIINCPKINLNSVNHLIKYAPSSSLKTIEIVDCSSGTASASWSDDPHLLKKKGITLVIK